MYAQQNEKQILTGLKLASVCKVINLHIPNEKQVSHVYLTWMLAKERAEGVEKEE